MSVEVSSEQAYAFAEILEILSFTHAGLVEKVPDKLISIFKNHALSTYEHHLNKNIPLEDQELSSETATLLTLISLNYWCSPEEKKELQQILAENDTIQKIELEEKYNVNNIFKNQNTETFESNLSEEKTITESSINSNLPMDIIALPWYKKVIIKLNELISKIIKK